MNILESAADPNGAIRRVLIVGVSGFIGSALAVGLRNHFEVFGTYATHPVRIEGVTCLPLNCINGGEILELLQRLKPEAVLYCAGVTDPEIASQHPNLAESLHFKAPTVFFKILPVVLRFVYFSTDEVFGNASALGQSTPFVENAQTNPLNPMTRTRAQGEALSLGHKKFTAIMRLGGVYGESFNTLDARASHWLNALQKNLERGQPYPLFEDQIRNYLYIGDLVRAVRLYLAKSPLEAVSYNIAGTEAVSQFEFGRRYCEAMGYDPALVKPTSVTRAHEPQPGNISLSSSKFSTQYNFKFQSVTEGLQEWAERLRTGFTKDWT